MEMDDIDGSMVKAFVLVIVLIIGIVIVTWYGIHTIQLRPYEKECTENPRLRYAQECTTQKDCIQLCARRLQAEDE